MLLSSILFFFIYLVFFSASVLRLFLLFLGSLGFLAALFSLFYANTLSAIFTTSIFIYKLEAVNLTYMFLIDGISAYFLLLTLLLFIICVLIAWNLRYKLREFLIVLLSINLFLVHVFAITDLVFFYVFFEALLIPMFLLIGV